MYEIICNGNIFTLFYMWMCGKHVYVCTFAFV